MNGRFHITLGLACAVTAAAAGLVPLSVSTLCSAAFGSLAPDVDTERSTLGCRALWLSRPISRFFGHRTVTHSLALPLAAAWLTVHFYGMILLQSAWGGFLIGYVSHIAADLMMGGCWALFPLARGRISFWPHAKAGSFKEYLLLICCLGVLSYVTYQCVYGHTSNPIASVGSLPAF